MILAVRCDKEQFKEVKFKDGFNLVVAERHNEATDRDSRNGLGKTTLIQIIDFCLGATYKKDEGIGKDELVGWTFILDIMIRSKIYTIYRNTEKHGIVYLEGDFSDWIVKPEPENGNHFLRVPVWRDVLGWLIFDLPISNEIGKYAPSYRSLISYFIRIGRDSYIEAFEHYKKQLEWDKQIHNAFLLGLGWEYARRWQLLRDREQALSKLKEIAKSDSKMLSNIVGTQGELDSERIRLQEQIDRQNTLLNNFQVHEQYHEIEKNANILTSDIRNLLNQNFHDTRLVDFYENSIREEQVDESLVESIYNEAGIILPESVIKRLEEVREFHRQLTSNRHEFLDSEINRLKNLIKNRQEQIKRKEQQKSELMRILDTHGALQEFNVMQDQFNQLQSRLREVNNKINNLRHLEQERVAIRIERDQLFLDAQADHEGRKPYLQRAISLFNAHSQFLYESPGDLIVNIEAKSGFKFDVKILRDNSDGINQIGKVFTYDLVLTELWAEKTINHRFLIHDSSIFDGVDERQVALAIKLAIKQSASAGFQYICCLNSDQIPYKDLGDINIEEYVRLRLTDNSPDGGLLGMRF